jgi:8-oxo-dGTP diphosphatase
MIEVAAAIIENDHGQILIARRRPGKSQAGLWEFPGGKLEAGESAADCLKRELAEEMAIEIEPRERFGVNEHDYGTFRIRLTAHRAAYIGGEVLLSDHDEYRWAWQDELDKYEWAPADVPFVRRLMAEAQSDARPQ